ncbi:rhomboid family intramembrane serine protease [Vicingus serpentipes]|uniref:Rhomboid family intramembrane serine protease n=1 Tax=Vicingus serpentipes TaxID=1926625 RepID=A0A5C6RV13_9FLAO|nr:rhomboid family intramembrane serine protease [Vicingus serpentipes]TXB65370.1 rhomboid family intramembrane serine protease [Vicingus serpentipes]
MKNPFIEDIKRQYKSGSALIKLIFINVAMFLLVHIVGLFLWFFGISNGSELMVYWLALPADFSNLITKPWSLISYMFLHESLMHILMNMLVLYFGGQIFLQFLNQNKLVGVYLLGGLAGGLLYILAFNIFPVFENVLMGSLALGASASVMAVLVAAATHVPNFVVRLVFLGNVKLKYVALVYVVLDIISIRQGNSGGHIAHIGGALLGFLFAKQLQTGKDITLFINQLLAYFKTMFSTKRKMKVVYKNPGKTKTDYDYNAQKKANQQKVDAILDKIAKSGYDSLTGEEKAILFDASNK